MRFIRRRLQCGLSTRWAVPARRSVPAAVVGLMALLGMVSVLSCATPTATLMPPSPTPTATPVPPSPTPTPIPPSPTPTATPAPPSPTPTATPLPPSPTVSPTPAPTRGNFESPLTSPLTSPLATPSLVTLLPPEVPVYGYRVVNVFPHDPGAWVQGLVFEDGVLYEGTGLLGQSTLRRVDLESGEVLQKHSLPPEYFGEGITVWGDRTIQLTWKSGRGFVYDRESFELLDSFRYATEGWGITHDGTKLIMSDGTATLHFWDPETFQEIGQVQVAEGLRLGMRFNELEYVQGQVYANVWYSDLIAMIDPDTGQLAGGIDLTGLYRPEEGRQPDDVLNGIAYDPAGDRLWVTGKFWPTLFEIELVPAQ